jgi:hypothetical protein
MKHRSSTLLAAVVLAAGLSSCSASDPGSRKVFKDDFNTNTPGHYTIYNTPEAWSIVDGYLNSGAPAKQSVVVPNGETMADGWVETQTSRVADGGLVLRFQGNGNYYLLAIRDDSWLPYANLEMYRAQGGDFTRIAGPLDVDFPVGKVRTIRSRRTGTC